MGDPTVHPAPTAAFCDMTRRDIEAVFEWALMAFTAFLIGVLAVSALILLFTGCQSPMPRSKQIYGRHTFPVNPSTKLNAKNGHANAHDVVTGKTTARAEGDVTARSQRLPSGSPSPDGYPKTPVQEPAPGSAVDAAVDERWRAMEALWMKEIREPVQIDLHLKGRPVKITTDGQWCSCIVIGD